MAEKKNAVIPWLEEEESDKEYIEPAKNNTSWFGQIFDNVGAFGNAAYSNIKDIGLTADIRDTYEKLYNGDYSSREEYDRLVQDFERMQNERREYKQRFQDNNAILEKNNSWLKDLAEVGGTVHGIGTQLKDTAMAAGAGAVTMGALGVGAGGIGAIPAALVGAAKGATWGNRFGAFHQAYEDARINAIDAWERVLQEGGTREQAEQAYNDALVNNLPTEALDVIGNLYFGSKILGNAVSSNMAQKLSKSALGKTAEKVSRFDLPAVVGTNVAKKFGSTAGKIAGGVTASTLEGIGESIQEPWQDYATERAIDIQRRQYDPNHEGIRDFSVLGDGGLLDYYTTPEGRETAWKSFKMGAAFGGIGSALSASQFTKLGTAHSDSIQGGKQQAKWIEDNKILQGDNLARFNEIKETMANIYDLSDDKKADLSVEDVARMYQEYYTNLFGQGGNRQEQNAVSQADFLNEITGEETARRGLMGDTATKYVDQFGIRPDNETLQSIRDNQQVLSEEQVEETLTNSDNEEATESDKKEGIKAKFTKGKFDEKTAKQAKEEKAEGQNQQKKGGLREQYGNWVRIDEGEGFDYQDESKYRNTETGRVARITKVNGGYTITDITDGEERKSTIANTLKDVTKFLGKKAKQKTAFMSDGSQEQVSEALPQEDGVIATKDITTDENGEQWFNGKKIQSKKAQVIHNMQDLHDYYKTHKDIMSKDLYAEISRQMMRFGIGNANNTELVLDLTNREAGGFGSESTFRTDPNDENSAIAKAVVRLYAGADLATAAHEMAHLGWLNLSDQDRDTFAKWAERTQGEFIAKILGRDYDQNFRSYLIEALTNRESQTSQDLWEKIKREGAVQQTLGILNGQNYGLAVEERFAWEFSNWYAQGYVKGAKPRNIIERILSKACASLQGALNLLYDTDRYLNGDKGYNGGDINNIFTNMSTQKVGQGRYTAPQVELRTEMSQPIKNAPYDYNQGFNEAEYTTLDSNPTQNLSRNTGTIGAQTYVTPQTEMKPEQDLSRNAGTVSRNDRTFKGEKHNPEGALQKNTAKYTPSLSRAEQAREAARVAEEQANAIYERINQPQEETSPVNNYANQEYNDADAEFLNNIINNTTNPQQNPQQQAQQPQQKKNKQNKQVQQEQSTLQPSSEDEYNKSIIENMKADEKSETARIKQIEKDEAQKKKEAEKAEKERLKKIQQEKKEKQKKKDDLKKNAESKIKSANSELNKKNPNFDDVNNQIMEVEKAIKEFSDEEYTQRMEQGINTPMSSEDRGTINRLQDGLKKLRDKLNDVKEKNPNKSVEQDQNNSTPKQQSLFGKEFEETKSEPKTQVEENTEKTKKTNTVEEPSLFDNQTEQVSEETSQTKTNQEEQTETKQTSVSDEEFNKGLEKIKDSKNITFKEDGKYSFNDEKIAKEIFGEKELSKKQKSDLFSAISQFVHEKSVELKREHDKKQRDSRKEKSQEAFDKLHKKYKNIGGKIIGDPSHRFKEEERSSIQYFMGLVDDHVISGDLIKYAYPYLEKNYESKMDELSDREKKVYDFMSKYLSDAEKISDWLDKNELGSKQETQETTNAEPVVKTETKTEPQTETAEQVQEEDDNYNRAVERVTKKGRTSVSDLKKELGIEYKEAVDLINRLEENNVISGGFDITDERRLVPEEDRQYPEYIAWVRDKETKKYQYLRYHYPTKTAFLKDLQGNGYTVYYIATKDTLDEESDKFNKRAEENRLRSKYVSREKRETAKRDKEKQEHLDSLSPEEREKEFEDAKKRIQEREELQKQDPFVNYRNKNGEIHDDKEGVHHKADDTIPSLPYEENGQNNPKTGAEYIKRITRKYSTSNKLLANLKAKIKRVINDKGGVIYDRQFLQDAIDQIDEIQMLRQKKKGTGTISAENNDCPWTSRMIWNNIIDQAYANKRSNNQTNTEQVSQTKENKNPKRFLDKIEEALGLSEPVSTKQEQVQQTKQEENKTQTTEKPKQRTFTGIRNKAIKDFNKNYIGREEALKNPDLSFARAYYDIVTTLEEGEGDFEELPLNQDGELSPSKAKAYFNKALTVLKYGADNGNPECNYWLAELASGEESPNIDMFDTVEEAIEERFEFSEEDIAQMYKVASDGGIKVAKSKLPDIETQTEVEEQTSPQTETATNTVEQGYENLNKVVNGLTKEEQEERETVISSWTRQLIKDINDKQITARRLGTLQSNVKNGIIEQEVYDEIINRVKNRNTPSTKMQLHSEEGMSKADTNSPAFKKWFEGSILKNEDGSPMVLYRGFRQRYNPKYNKEEGNAVWVSVDKVVAEQYRDLEENYGTINDNGDLAEVYVNIKNPFDIGQIDYVGTNHDIYMKMAKILKKDVDKGVITKEQMEQALRNLEYLNKKNKSGNYPRNAYSIWKQFKNKKFFNALKEIGYDSVKGYEYDDLTYGVFDKGNIKSIYNQGTFDKSNPDIRMQSSGNRNLNQAKAKKNDEFYTNIKDIEKEIPKYKEQFKDKVVYCNCDDPQSSNFWKYFVDNFDKLGIKKVISTHYNESGSYKLEYDGKNTKRTQLSGDGDFRSQESLDTLKQSDIVVSNPPFSLFRQYVKQLTDNNKQFLIIGNKNAITSKEVFPHIKNGNIKFGNNNVNSFVTPSGEVKRFGNIGWFTNLQTNKQYKEQQFTQRYYDNNGKPLPNIEQKYPKFDGTDIINVNRVADIPIDYDGIMGVPISFMDNYTESSPFEVVGTVNHGTDGDWDLSKSMIGGKEKFKRIAIKKKSPSTKMQSNGDYVYGRDGKKYPSLYQYKRDTNRPKRPNKIYQEQREELHEDFEETQNKSNTRFQSSGQNNLGYIDKQKDIYSVTFTKSAQQNAENKKKMAFYKANKSYWKENKDAQTGAITFTRALPYQQHQKTIIYDEINGKTVGKRKKSKAREYYEAFKDQLIKWLFNDKHFLEKAARNVGALESYMRMMVMKDQGAVAGAAIEDGIVKHNGKNGERTKSLNSIIEAVGEENQTDFLNYCEAYRVLDLEKRNIYQKMKPDDARKEIAKVQRSKNAKLFEQQRQYFVEYNHELLWVLVDGGFITEQQYNKFIENDPNFIPLAKNMDELEGYVDGFRDSKTMINVAHPMHKIGTSMREVANPFLEMQKRTVEYYVKASRNKAGHIFVNDIAKAIAQDAQGNVVKQNQGMVRKLASRDRNGNPISHDNKQYVFYVWENGEKQYYQVADREIYVALKSFDAEQMSALSKIMNQTAGKASRLVRNTATMTPDFGLRNLVRDNFEAFVSSEHGFLPLVDSIWGMYQMANDTQWFKEYQRMNGEHLSLNRDGEDVATVEHDIKDNVKMHKTYMPLIKKDFREFTDKNRSIPARAKSLLLLATDVTGLHSLYKMNKRLNDYLEIGTRIGEYRNARMGYKGLKGRLFETQGSTIFTNDKDLARAKNTEMIAAYKSKDITLNFGQHGILGKELNRYIPFFNASLQGIYKLGNTIDDMFHAEDARRRQELMFKCVLMGAIGMAAALAGQGDDDYEEAPDYEHENFWILPNGIRIPKDQLFGKLIGGTVEKATAQYLKDGDVKKLELIQDILGNFAIDKCVPALVDLGWGTIGNYDSFKKKSVTPEYMADKLGYLQKDLSTSKLGVDVSETLYKAFGIDVGAKKVDFVVSKTLSNLGKYATSLWELTGGNEKMTRGAEVEDKGGFAEWSKELPYPMNSIVGTFATNRNSFQSISDFYERHRELKKLSSDETIMSKNEKKAWEAYQAAYKKDKQYRDALRAIKQDKSLTGAQKRQKADKIFKQQISMARKLRDWEKKHGLV